MIIIFKGVVVANKSVKTLEIALIHYLPLNEGPPNAQGGGGEEGSAGGEGQVSYDSGRRNGGGGRGGRGRGEADIDEQIVPWKGRHRCRFFNPSKPERWHSLLQQ